MSTSCWLPENVSRVQRDVSIRYPLPSVPLGCASYHLRELHVSWRCLFSPVSLGNLLHSLNICSPHVLDKLEISQFASSKDACSEPTQGCNKAARSGRKIEQNEVPKPGPQNRQFYSDAWAYPHSSKHAVRFFHA